MGFPVARAIAGCSKATCKWGNRSRNRNRRRPLPLSLPEQNGEEDDDNDDDDDDEDDENTERESTDKEDEESDSVKDGECDDNEREFTDKEDDESDSVKDGDCGEENTREDVYELEYVIDHKVVTNKDGSNPQDQYQVSWVGLDIGTDWTSAERIMTWVRPDLQQNNRELLERYKATSEGTKRHNIKVAKLAKRKQTK